MKRILLILMIVICLISFTSALDNQGVGKEGENFTFIQICDDATYITLSSIQYPNRTVEIINENMSSMGGGIFQYNFTDMVNGRHDPTGISDGCEKTFATYFIINPTGTILTNGEAILFGFIILLIGIFLFFSIMGVSKASEGSWLIAYICLTYILLYILMGICYLLSRDFLWSSTIFKNILYIVWFIMGIGFLPFVIVLSLYILGKEAMAALEEDYIRQGYNREEAKELSKKHKR